jgi:hypothetical protein
MRARVYNALILLQFISLFACFSGQAFFPSSFKKNCRQAAIFFVPHC